MSPTRCAWKGYTDDRPIHTLQFNSNWELSAARAASVVHVMIDGGVAPSRLEVVGYGEQQPVADNRTEQGRNANRRVQLVIMAAPEPRDAPREAETVLADDAADLPQAPAPATAPNHPPRAVPPPASPARSVDDVARSEEKILARQDGAQAAGAH